MLRRNLVVACLAAVFFAGGFAVHPLIMPPHASVVTPIQSAPRIDQSAALRLVTPAPTATPILAAQPTDEPDAIAPTTSRSDTMHTRIVATGDVMLGRMVRVWAEGLDNWNWPFEATQALVSSGDITIVNFENPIVDPCERNPNDSIFCATPESVDGLVYAGVDIANIANNHINDQGPEGIAFTIATLNGAGIEVSDETHVVSRERGDVTFGFVGFNLVWQNKDSVILPDEEILARIKALDSQFDVLVVSLHWGTEFRTYPTYKQTQMGHAAIDAGADVIIGNHPHVTEGYEEYNGKLIIYSLGNYIFDQLFDYNARHGHIAVLEFVGDRLVSYEFVRTETVDDLQPRYVDPASVPLP